MLRFPEFVQSPQASQHFTEAAEIPVDAAIEFRRGDHDAVRQL